MDNLSYEDRNRNTGFNTNIRSDPVKLLLLIIGLMLLIGTASATDYYVKTTGDNSNNGLSIVTAWQNISYGVTQLIAGDTLYVLNGTWNNEHVEFWVSGTDGNPITVQAHNGTPYMNGTDKTGFGFVQNSTNWTVIDGLELSHYEACISMMGNNNTVQNCIMHDTDGVIIGTGTEGHYNTIQNSTFYMSGWNTIQVSGKRAPPVGTGVPATNHQILNNVIYNSYEHNGIDLFGCLENITIHGNEIYDSGYNAIYTHSNDGSTEFDTVYDLTITDNYIHDITFTGMGLKEGLHRVNVSNNRFENIPDAGYGIDIYGRSTSKTYDFIICNNSFNNITNSVLLVGIVNLSFDSNNIYGGSGHPKTKWSASENNSIYNPIGSQSIVISNRAHAWFGYKNGTVFTSTYWEGRANGANYTPPRYYTDRSVSYQNETFGDSDTSMTITAAYAITLKPTSDYLFDVVVNDYDIVTDDIMNITVNSTVSDNPSYINVTMKNATANYTVYVDSVSKGTVESDANSVASYQYSDLWGGNDKVIVFDWASGGSVGAPSITSHTPNTPNSTETDDTAIFTAETDQTVNFTTWLNGASIQTNNSVTSMSYTNISGQVGVHNLTISVENVNGADSMQWEWTVTQTWSPTANTTYGNISESWSVNGIRWWPGNQPQSDDVVITGWQVIPS